MLEIDTSNCHQIKEACKACKITFIDQACILLQEEEEKKEKGQKEAEKDTEGSTPESVSSTTILFLPPEEIEHCIYLAGGIVLGFEVIASHMIDASWLFIF